jgi:hypothetical protein
MATHSTLWIPIALLVVGLIASVSIGLIAWYNSKRPPGWEETAIPSYIPKINIRQESEKQVEEKNLGNSENLSISENPENLGNPDNPENSQNSEN